MTNKKDGTLKKKELAKGMEITKKASKVAEK